MLPATPPHPDADPTARQLAGLAELLHLEKEVRAARNLEALGFVLVNSTYRLLNFHQSILWLAQGHPRIVTVSGLTRFDPRAPQMLWLRRVFVELALTKDAHSIRSLQSQDMSESLRRSWAEWTAPYALSIPLNDPLRGTLLGGLFLVRESPWTARELDLARHLAESYSQAVTLMLYAKRPLPFPIPARRFFVWFLILALVGGILMLPVRLSVLAPAEVIPVEPTMVTAPLAGVIAQFHVVPNAVVQTDQPLFELEPSEGKSHMDVAQENLALARARYRQEAQRAFVNSRSESDLGILHHEIQKSALELAYATQLLDRMKITAHKAGVAVFADPNEWLGRPVHLGERVLFIADPNKVALEIHLPVDDAMGFDPGALVRVFMNSAPLSPKNAMLDYASYEAQNGANGVLAYRLKAHFSPEEPLPRLGERGTAKIYGRSVYLAYYLLRRPLAALRRLAGM